MNFLTLKTLIAGQVGSDDAIAQWCNTPVTMLRETFVTKRTLMARLETDEGTQVMSALTAAAESSKMLALTVSMMDPNQGGIDVALTSVRTQIDELEQNSVLTMSQVNAIKALAEYNVSPATLAGLPEINHQHIAHTRVI